VRDPDRQRRAALRRALLAWYRRTARDLPWRKTRDPYRIWLSEILLQQTRVQTVVPYYERFLAAFPTVRALAAVALDRVLKLWEGLGYYTRARNLHRAAQTIASVGGRFPRTAAEWQCLPGIGPYTAGAIASMAAGEAVAAVDGNVQRVLARIFGIRACVDTSATQAELWRLAEKLLPRKSPGDFNQALMELGARVCRPRGPLCGECPIRARCAAYAGGMQAELPVRRPKRPVPRVEAVAALVQRRGRYLIIQRPPTGLLAGLYTLPGCELAAGASHAGALRIHVRAALGIDIGLGPPLGSIRHEFSHRRLHIHVYAARLLPGPQRLRATGKARWVTPAQLAALPMAAVDRNLLRLGLDESRPL
jgi:A/G-specific adenine glycosylase